MKRKTEDKTMTVKVKNKYETIKSEIFLNAILNLVYFDKQSTQTICTKMNHQLNAMETTIHKINPKFEFKSKNYEKIRQEMLTTLNHYEKALKQLANQYDKKLEKMIFDKVALESKLLTAIVGKEPNKKQIFQLEKEIRICNKKIQHCNTQKINQIFSAMEIGGKELTTDIRKQKNITKITSFFSNRFNTYNVIMKSVINPLNQKIDEFKVNTLKKVNGKIRKFDLKKMQEKIKFIQNNCPN